MCTHMRLYAVALFFSLICSSGCLNSLPYISKNTLAISKFIGNKSSQVGLTGPPEGCAKSGHDINIILSNNVLIPGSSKAKAKIS